QSVCLALSHACTLAVAVFFFFQAEDGIRDWSVTGVQTCALPIFTRRNDRTLAGDGKFVANRDQWRIRAIGPDRELQVENLRSGEIGRASCRERGEISGGGGYVKKKKKKKGEGSKERDRESAIGR